MNLDSHLSELRKRHAQLSHRIDDETRSPGSDDLTISALKREKLKLKDEISRLSRSLH